jgi:L,D-peptidoglycan transpeptidase YkuD (ErfK/YbiS/YcfS/YnhG family)
MRPLSRHPLALAVSCAVAVLLAVLVGVIAFADPARATPLPGQVLTVQSSSATSTTASVAMWQLDAKGVYARVSPVMSAWVGERGIGATHDNLARTPAGVFGLTQAFGNQPNNGTRLPYFQAGPADWWNGEDASPAYNTHVRQPNSPGPGSENLYYAGAVYAHAVVINYNMSPVIKGAGSAFFLHVANGQPTLGCVALPAVNLTQVMRWLNPAQHPVISIGVGAAAQKIITSSHNPRGAFDTATARGSGQTRLQGWAFDRDPPSTLTQVDVYIDQRRWGRVSTGYYRPDVARAKGVAANHGYDTTITTTRGRHVFCVFAINSGAGTTNPPLGCKTVTVR